MEIVVGARSSPLSLAQVKEVFSLLPHLQSKLICFDTVGDRDQKTSLRHLEKTDFFTKEIDDALLEGKIRIAIHAAKDLPDPLRNGLKVIALTQGVDAWDVLVFNRDVEKPLIATSSFRREEAVLKVMPQARFQDIRGTVNERLKKLDDGLIDGVVVAEAALIRLGLNGRRRVRLPGETAHYQGRLAVVAREDDVEMHSCFSTVDARTKATFGVTKPEGIDVIHAPLIETVKLPPHFEGIERASHILFTSKTGARLFFEKWRGDVPEIIAIGEGTAKEVRRYTEKAVQIPGEATQEGVVALINTLNITTLFWPRSEQARDVIFQARTCVIAPPFYKTVTKRDVPKLNWDAIEELFFTSPSTVKAFSHHFGDKINGKICHAIGPVTHRSMPTPQR